MTVIGVVDDVRYHAWDDPGQDVYVPVERWKFPRMDLLVKTDGEPHAVIPAVRQAVERIDPDLALGDLTTLDQAVDHALAGRRFASILLAALAGVALLLTAVGIASLLAAWVEALQRELGVRLAMGADRASLVHLVARRAGLLIALGLALGLGLFVLVSRGLESYLLRDAGRRRHLPRHRRSGPRGDRGPRRRRAVCAESSPPTHWWSCAKSDRDPLTTRVLSAPHRIPTPAD